MDCHLSAIAECVREFLAIAGRELNHRGAFDGGTLDGAMANGHHGVSAFGEFAIQLAKVRGSGGLGLYFIEDFFTILIKELHIELFKVIADVNRATGLGHVFRSRRKMEGNIAVVFAI